MSDQHVRLVRSIEYWDSDSPAIAAALKALHELSGWFRELHAAGSLTDIAIELLDKRIAIIRRTLMRFAR